jgi:hypothetical protein
MRELGATLRWWKVSVNAEERDWLKVVTQHVTGIWWARKDLNLGPMDYESTALTAELRARLLRLLSSPELSAQSRAARQFECHGFRL